METPAGWADESDLVSPLADAAGSVCTVSDAMLVPGAGGDPGVPAYLEETYRWAYLSPRTLAFFDQPWVVSTILFGNYRRLERVFLEEIAPATRVLQAACVYGNFSKNLASRLGPRGMLHVIDVARLQVVHCARKLRPFPHAQVSLADAASLGDSTYDAVACFFLLHELPDDYKRTVLNALLGCVRPGGKVVFVDYHKPHFANPLKGVLSLVFRTLEPFAKSLWRNEISGFAEAPEEFEWDKRTYFGGLYQKVVALRRE